MNEPICPHCGGGPSDEQHQRECEEDTVLYQQQARINTLKAENARLQERLEENRWTAIEHIDDHLKADCVVCGSPHKALAERRGEALEAILTYIDDMAARTSGQTKEMIPDKRIGVARAAIAATPEEALKKKQK